MKIADFGLARGVHQIDYYKKTTNVSEGLQHHFLSVVSSARGGMLSLVNMLYQQRCPSDYALSYLAVVPESKWFSIRQSQVEAEFLSLVIVRCCVCIMKSKSNNE